MLTQKIIGTEYKKVKYHGSVKFLIFECNFCSKRFSKMESYCRKQLKIHKNACCFCSPLCRNKYFLPEFGARSKSASKDYNGSRLKSSSTQRRGTVPKTAKDESFFGWFNRLFE